MGVNLVGLSHKLAVECSTILPSGRSHKITETI